ncbi:MAG: electron transfer flavoprotein subunit beta/FixA family protein [Candidatus Cloacimonetes bacterium]|nr:electron transfer flavoprotein subunit beta/FixA family protein [Candidatus Cloacimonadota bacterium]
MKFFVCCKQVPDVAMAFQIKDGELQKDDLNYVLNAYDASAVEESLVIKDAVSELDLSLVLMGAEKGKEALRKGLAMGANDAFHIEDDAFEGSDSHAAANVLEAFFKDKEYDAILCGKQSQDMDMGLTGGLLAEKLNIPYVTNAVGLEVNEEAKSILVTRQGDAGQEKVELSFPCIVSCSNDMNEPRIPSLRGIMQSKKKPMNKVSVADLGLATDAVGKSGSKSTLLSMDFPKARKAGEKFEGEASELVSTLIDKLTNEAKVL